MLRSACPEWKDLQSHAKDMRGARIDRLFEQDPARFDSFHIAHDGLLLDYAKTAASRETVAKLLALARASGLEDWRDRMFSGSPVNSTENRAVLHTALRREKNDTLELNGEDIVPQIHHVLARMEIFSENLRETRKFTHIVNIGIGGSDLGPYMACEALKPFSDRDISLHFVSNIDSAHLCEKLRLVDPAKTLFIVTSKSFTTQETMTNAHSARDWLREKLGRQDVSDRFIAITANTDEARAFGMEEDAIFPMWDWVGGRYSLWSAIGLPICIAIGYDNFEKLLAGARSMDNHFRKTPLERNMPVLFGLIGVWHRTFMDCPAVTVAPYEQSLHALVGYLQQLDMESNGKRVDRDGNTLDYETGPVIFGKPGTNGQHAFFQLIHQGTSIIPVEFIAALKSQHPLGDHHAKLLSNAIGQSKALMDGKDNDNPHKCFPGNRPSLTLLLDELDPYHLGMLLALYEHKVFVQGIIWNINSFDQWGVQLGKILADRVYNKLLAADQTPEDLDSSTLALITRVKNT